jgi:hypothetical protein
MQDELQLIEQIKAKLQDEIERQKGAKPKNYTKQDLIDAAAKRAASKKKTYTKEDLEAAARKAMETKKSPTKQDMINFLNKKYGK